MAKHYEFPSPVVLTQAGRAYLDTITLEFVEPGRADNYSVIVKWLITDPNGGKLGSRSANFTAANWQGFISGLAPGENFEAAVLELTGALLSEVPLGGTVEDDAP